MKKYLLTAIIALLCLGALLCLSACGSDTATTTEAKGCNHSEETVAGKAATCTEAGLTDGKKCSKCGEILVEQEVINALGHTEITVDAKSPTCTETGLTEGKKCSVCNTFTVEQTVIPATGHTEITLDAVPSTCKEAGLSAGKKCSVCDTVTVKQQKLPLGEHNYVKGECTVCQKNVGEGLEFTLNSDGQSYSVTGIGTYESTDVIIPEIYKTLPVTTIGVRAFFNCDNITSVTIPSSVTVIDNEAFVGCINLSSVSIPDSVTTIGTGAFMNCYGISSLTIGKGVVSIGNRAFSGCGKLTSVVIPNKVSSIGSSAFSGCTDLLSITLGQLVNSIGENAFVSCPKIVEIYNLSALDVNPYFYNEKVIHTSASAESILKTVGDYIFMRYQGNNFLMCYIGNNNEITLPQDYNGEEYQIYRYAFANRKDITKVVISDKVTAIGINAFENCSELTDIKIGSGVTAIADYAFMSCLKLARVDVNSLNTWFNIQFGNQYANPIRYATNLYVNGSLLTELTIPESVNTVNSYAFCNLDCLETVVIPGHVTSIGFGAFADCSNIKTITVPFLGASLDNAENDKFGYIFGTTSYGLDHKTAVPSSLKTVVITGGTFIADNAFNGCQYIESITLPDTVVTIGHQSFRDCTALSSISIPQNLTTVGSLAFDNCSGLTKVNIKSLEGWCNINFGPNLVANPLYYAKNLYLNDTLVTEIVIPGSVTEIKCLAFTGCTNITKVTIHDGVTLIAEEAFRGCSELTTVTVGSGVIRIEPKAFNGCTKLSSVTFANTSGWYSTSNQYASSGTSLNLTDTGNNATMIRENNYNYWKRNP